MRCGGSFENGFHAEPVPTLAGRTTYDPAVRSVVVAGPESADAIVFLHGASFNLAMWQPQLEGLANEFRCIAADLPGHGELRRTPFLSRKEITRGIEKRCLEVQIMASFWHCKRSVPVSGLRRQSMPVTDRLQ
jgi:pimeloyl-ACP methyl ester carboxylesterase